MLARTKELYLAIRYPTVPQKEELATAIARLVMYPLLLITVWWVGYLLWLLLLVPIYGVERTAQLLPELSSATFALGAVPILIFVLFVAVCVASAWKNERYVPIEAGAALLAVLVNLYPVLAYFSGDDSLLMSESFLIKASLWLLYGFIYLVDIVVSASILCELTCKASRDSLGIRG